MTTILIADSSKPSIVMTSEVVKDKISGAVVLVSGSGRSCIDMVTELKPDLCIIDFDLPDVDGPSLVAALRRVYDGPILMTAFPDAVVTDACSKDLFMCNDASGWIGKPIKSVELAAKLEKFLVERHRLGKRFTTALTSQIVGKASGRGKRAPKVKGKVINLSLGGACVRIDSPLKVKKAQEFTLSIAIPKEGASAKSQKKPDKGKSTTKGGGAPSKIPTVEAKFKTKVAWADSDCQLGLEFSKLTEVQKKSLESYLRAQGIIPSV